MSALDQAFIKAYSQQNSALAPAVVATSKKTCVQKEPPKAAISVDSAPVAAVPQVSREAEPTTTSSTATKALSKRKAKSPGKAATDSVFKAIEQIGGKKTSPKKRAATKKTTPEKKAKNPKTNSEEAASNMKKPSASDAIYRLDLPATTAGVPALDRPTIPAPHTDVIFSGTDTVSSPRETASSQAVLRNAELPSRKKETAASKAAATLAKKSAPSHPAVKNAPSENQIPSSFSAGWTEDLRLAFNSLDQNTQTAEPPEPVPEPESAKTPAQIIESLSPGMKQQAAVKTPLPEKRLVQEETPRQNKSTTPKRPVASEVPYHSMKKNAAEASKGSPLAMSNTLDKTSSNYSDAAEPSPTPAIRLFQPMLQVDHFAWPKVCGRLESGADAELERVIETLLAAQVRGKKVFALGGCHSGDGATSLLLATARRLAAQGIKVALVEGDWCQPQLARRLGLLPQYGWEDVLFGRLPLEEVLIESIAERLVILPVREPFGAAELPRDAAGRLVESWNSLRRHFDIVLVDPGVLVSSPILDPQFLPVMAGRIDAALLVKNLRQHDKTEFDAVAQSLHNIGTKVLGVVENFAG